MSLHLHNYHPSLTMGYGEKVYIPCKKCKNIEEKIVLDCILSKKSPFSESK